MLADAAHNLGDVVGLLLAWGAAELAARRPQGRWTYGLRRSTVLAGLANAGLVLLAVGSVSWEAILRLREPATVDGWFVLGVAAAGLVVNGLAGWLLVRGRSGDVNVRAAAVHLFADAAVSGGVVIAGAVIVATGWAWIDPATSLVVSVVVLVSTWGILRDATRLVLDAVPTHVDLEAVRSYLCGLPGVREGARHHGGRPDRAPPRSAHRLRPRLPARGRPRAARALRDRPRHAAARDRRDREDLRTRPRRPRVTITAASRRA